MQYSGASGGVLTGPLEEAGSLLLQALKASSSKVTSWRMACYSLMATTRMGEPSQPRIFKGNTVKSTIFCTS